MSHVSKVELIKKAKSNGYKTYLYFVYTKNPELNITRVQLRALMGLHDVNPDLIRNRYKRSFELLPLAFEETHEAYLFDNSDALNLVAQKRNGKVTFGSLISDDIKKMLL